MPCYLDYTVSPFSFTAIPIHSRIMMLKSEEDEFPSRALAAVFPKDVETLSRLRAESEGVEEICSDYELLFDELARLPSHEDDDTKMLRVQIHESLDALREEIVGFLYPSTSS